MSLYRLFWCYVNISLIFVISIGFYKSNIKWFIMIINFFKVSKIFWVIVKIKVFVIYFNSLWILKGFIVVC